MWVYSESRMYKMSDSHSAGVQHDAQGCTHGAGGQILAELGSDNTTVSVRLSHATPDAPVLGTVLLLASAVDEGHALAHVELGLFAGQNTIDFDEGSVALVV